MSMFLAGATSALNRVFHPFSYLWNKIMGDPTYPRDIFPEKQQVEDWKKALANLPLMHDLPNLSQLLEIRNTTIVSKLYFCKQKSLSKHEFIVADLRRKDGSHVHAIIERYRADSSPDDEEKEIESRETEIESSDEGSSPAPSTDRNLSGGLIILSASLQKRSKADDRVRCVPGRFPPSSVIKAYTFTPDHEPTVMDLSIAAFVAHEHDRYYSLFSRQCYWYADAVCAAIEDTVGRDHYQVEVRPGQQGAEVREEERVYLGPNEIEALRPSSSAEYRNERVMAVELQLDQWTNLRQGYFNFLKISARNPKIVRILRQEFDKVKKQFIDKDAAGKQREVERRMLKEQEKVIEAQAKELEELRAYKARLLSQTPSGSNEL